MPPTFLLAFFVPPLVLAIGLIPAAILLARRVGLVVPFAFVATYALGVGAVTFLNVAVFDMADPKFRELWMKSWLEMYWSLWSVYFAPSAISALLATWLSRLTKGKEAAVLLGAFLLLILAAIDAWVLDPYIGRKGPWFLLGAFAFLSTVFLAIAMVARDSKTGPTRSLESS